MRMRLPGPVANAFGKRMAVVLQSEMLECAHACVAMVARHHGADWTLDRLRERFVPSTRGASVSQLVRMSNDIGLHARILRAEPHHLRQLALPCVLHWDGSHYVVLERVGATSFGIVDPALGRLEVGAAEFDKRFTGIAVEFSPGPRLSDPAPATGRGALALVRRGLRQHAAGLAAVVALALLIEGCSLVSPLLVQVATDKAIPAGDASLLVLLCAAFAAASLVQAGVSVARTSLLLQVGAKLIVAWNTEICSRILRLPYTFFLRRSVGDLTSRFRSVDVIQRTITARFLQAMLDGLTSIFILAIILRYSPLLVAITAGFTAAYACLRLLTLPRLIEVTEASIRLQASQSTLLLDALRGIQSIKANGFEDNQLARYHAKTKATANSSLRLERWTSTVEEGGQLIVRLHWIAAVGAASALVMRGALTPGMLIAYITYAHQFTTRSARLLDRLADWKLLLLHADRVSELIDGDGAPAETGPAAPARDCSLSIRDLAFRYDAGSGAVIERLSLDVRDGECIAITGPSGSGKSTLAKIIMGLLPPTAGTVEIGGQPAAGMDRSGLRARIACVMQDDQLFNGTIAGNIAFFEPGYERDAVVEAAKLANIHDEIMAMPLQYESRIFDLGASLSGGQRQRLILARALYRRPSILVLDEASSHLDLDNECRVNEAISKLRITRIVIAHRPATLEMADRVYRMHGGALAPVARGEPIRAVAAAAV
jgi:ATP-binding cassette subfamily B protein RaxB